MRPVACNRLEEDTHARLSRALLRDLCLPATWAQSVPVSSGTEYPTDGDLVTDGAEDAAQTPQTALRAPDR